MAEDLQAKVEQLEKINEELRNHMVDVIIEYQDQIDHLREAHRQLVEKKMMERELQIAAEIQTRLLPKEIPNVQGLQISGTMKAAKEIGGDYYDFFRSETFRGINICIGDVSGKGVPAGLIMVMARSFLRSLLSTNKSLKEVMANLNSFLIQDMKETQFMTMLVCHWEETEQKLKYVGAGHEHILIYKAKEKKLIAIKTGGIMIGMLPDISPIIKEKEIELEEGDLVLLYTDGVTEARNKDDDLFGLTRVKEYLVKYGHLDSEAFLNRMMGELLSFMGDQKQFDDITMIALKKI